MSTPAKGRVQIKTFCTVMDSSLTMLAIHDAKINTWLEETRSSIVHIDMQLIETVNKVLYITAVTYITPTYIGINDI